MRYECRCPPHRLDCPGDSGGSTSTRRRSRTGAPAQCGSATDTLRSNPVGMRNSTQYCAGSPSRSGRSPTVAAMRSSASSLGAPGGALIAAPNGSDHTQAPRGASAECSALHDSQDGVAKRFSPGGSMLHRARTGLHRPRCPGARRASEVRLPKQRRKPVTRLASHRSASLAAHGVASEACGSAPSLEGNTCVYDAPTTPRSRRCDEAGNTFPRRASDPTSLS